MTDQVAEMSTTILDSEKMSRDEMLSLKSNVGSTPMRMLLR
jgi:hypothetical protein